MAVHFNERRDARMLWASSIGKVAASLLRWLGMARIVEAIKAQPQIEKLFFKNSRSPHRQSDFSAEFQRSVSRANASIEAYVESHAVERGYGWLVNKQSRVLGGEP